MTVARLIKCAARAHRPAERKVGVQNVGKMQVLLKSAG